MVSGILDCNLREEILGNKTALYDRHREESAKIVNFSGWDMPLHYGSQIREHNAVRASSGKFDVSHMVVMDMHGGGSRELLETLLANDIAKLDDLPGRALYSPMLNESGGVIDDVIVYFVHKNYYRVVSNCGTRKRVLEWYKYHASAIDVTFSERNDLAIVAIQGPDSLEKVLPLIPDLVEGVKPLKPFQFVYRNSWFVARTGYTGESGVEVILPNSAAEEFWNKLGDVGVVSCGLGARDTLRLEAGFNLYGHEMDEEVSPLAANLEWTISWVPEERKFIGREATEKQRGKNRMTLNGIVLEERGVLRAGQPVRFQGTKVKGITTSGIYSPTLEKSIALVRMPVVDAEECFVQIRGKELKARIVSPRFVQQGRILV